MHGKRAGSPGSSDERDAVDDLAAGPDLVAIELRRLAACPNLENTGAGNDGIRVFGESRETLPRRPNVRCRGNTG